MTLESCREMAFRDAYVIGRQLLMKVEALLQSARRRVKRSGKKNGDGVAEKCGRIKNGAWLGC